MNSYCTLVNSLCTFCALKHAILGPVANGEHVCRCSRLFVDGVVVVGGHKFVVKNLKLHILHRAKMYHVSTVIWLEKQV